MKRRDLLKLSALTGLAAISTQASAEACSTDGTPNQFIPKKAADAKPLENEFEKYPKCPYCGMDRKEHHRARMLVQYSDDLNDGMTKRSKHSFASTDVAKEFQAKHGGTLAKFDDALRESYLDMAADATMIRKNREERRKRAAEMKKG